MLNLTVAGRLTKDAVSKDVSGKSVTNFTVAVDVGFGDHKHAVFVDCAGWGDRYSKLASYLTKGTALTVNGRGDLRLWESAAGNHGATITLDVAEVTLQGSKQNAAAPGYGGDPAPATAAPDLDDEIPF